MCTRLSPRPWRDARGFQWSKDAARSSTVNAGRYPAGMSFVRRQLVTAAVSANALHPLPGYQAGVPTMVSGWLAGELAPHLLALTAADTARELLRRRRSGPGLALAAGSLAGLSAVVAQSLLAQGYVDRALVDALGADYLDRLSARHTDLDLSVPWQQLALPFRHGEDEVEVISDIAYAEHGKRGLLDVYRRRDADLGAAPVLLQVHGGAWSLGDKEHQGLPLMRHMAARGWVCVAINYRLSPRNAFPAHLVDVKRALAWIRGPGTAYGADPGFVAVTGGSAGGHLAAMAALTPNDPAYQPGFEEADTSVQAAVPHYGVYDLAGATGTTRSRQHARPLPRPRGSCSSTRATDPEAFERASPLLNVGPDAPPFLVIHGRNDCLVEVEQARRFVGRAARRLARARRLRRAARGPARLRRVPVDPERGRGAGRRPVPPVHPRRVVGMSRVPAMPADLLALARDRREGLHARGRGRCCCTDVAPEPSPTGPASRSAPTAASPRSTSARPPARSAASCSPSTTTAAPRRTRPAGSTTTPALADPEFGRLDTLPTFRHTIEDAGLEEEVVAVVGRSTTVSAHWRTPLALLFIDGGHAEEHAYADYAGLGPLGRAGGHARGPRRVPRPRGRRPAAVRRLPAGAGRRLRGDRRVRVDAGAHPAAGRRASA